MESPPAKEQRRQAFLELLLARKQEAPRMVDRPPPAYTDAQAKTLLEQIQSYAVIKNHSQRRMAGLLDIADSSYSDLLNGKYSGDSDRHLRKIEQFLDREGERDNKPDLTAFAQTSVATNIFNALKLNHAYGTMGAVIGNAGVGKTMAFQQYALETEGVIYLDAASWIRSPAQLSRVLARILIRGRSPRDMQDRCELLLEELRGSSRLLIIDQAHQLTEACHEFLQNLWDHCNPDPRNRRLGIVLGCTFRFMDQINDPKANYLYEQLTRRISMGASAKIGMPAFTMADIRKVFGSQKTTYPIPESAYKRLFEEANKKGGLSNAVSLLEKIQDVLKRQKAPAATEITVEMLDKVERMMLRRAA